jgi:uncharacterized membrane protein YtjA (UPF0391 family)
MQRARAGDQTQCIAVNPLRRMQPGDIAMLHYAVVFFVIALIAALFGFTGIAAGAASIAQVLFVVFIVLAIGSFVMSMVRKR